MTKKYIWVLLSLLVVVGLLVSCTEDVISPSPTSSPSPSPFPSTTSSPTIKPTATPTATTSPAQPAKIKWTVQNQYTTAAPYAHWQYVGAGWIAQPWKKFVEDISDGQVEVNIALPGAVVPVMDQLSATSKGVLDASVLSYAGYWSAQYPEFDIEIGLPFAWTSVEESWDAMRYWGLYKEFQDIYEKELNIHWLPIPCDDVYNFGTTFPIDTPDAVKGKKIRATGIYGDFVKALGGSPVNIPSTELYMALKLGTIDGTIFGIAGLEQVKLKEIWKYYVTQPNMNTIVGNALINLDKWKALPERVRYLYDEYGFAVMQRGMAEYQQQWVYMIQTAAKDYGFKTVSWSATDSANVFKIGVDLWDTVAAKSARAAKLVGIVKQQAKALGKIK